MEYDIGHLVDCGDSLGWIVDKKENDGIITYKVDWADGWDHDECWYEEERIEAFIEALQKL